MSSPDGAGPGAIRRKAGDMVKVELRHQIAQRPYVDLVRAEGLFHQGGDGAGLLHQLLLLLRRQMVNFPQIGHPRYQDLVVR